MIPGSNEVFISLLFGLFGFLIAFFVVRHSINVVMFTALTYATFRALDNFDVKADWAHFDNLAYTLADLGNTVYSIVTYTLEAASTLSLIFFIGGGIAGLTLRRHGH